jgi:hypothetical protein
VLSKSEGKYLLTFVDDFSQKFLVYILKNKDQVFENFKAWKVLVENQTDKRIKKFRTDNGLDFCS